MASTRPATTDSIQANVFDIVHDETADGIDSNIIFDWEPDLKRADAADPNIGLEDGTLIKCFISTLIRVVSGTFNFF
jgi:hypothetical protein